MYIQGRESQVQQGYTRLHDHRRQAITIICLVHNQILHVPHNTVQNNYTVYVGSYFIRIILHNSVERAPASIEISPIEIGISTCIHAVLGSRRLLVIFFVDKIWSPG